MESLGTETRVEDCYRVCVGTQREFGAREGRRLPRVSLEKKGKKKFRNLVEN